MKRAVFTECVSQIKTALVLRRTSGMGSRLHMELFVYYGIIRGISAEGVFLNLNTYKAYS